MIKYSKSLLNTLIIISGCVNNDNGISSGYGSRLRESLSE